jgi:hypothetical protein
MVKRNLARVRSRSGRMCGVFSTGLTGLLRSYVVSATDIQGNGGIGLLRSSPSDVQIFTETQPGRFQKGDEK